MTQNTEQNVRTREDLLPCPFCGGDAKRFDLAEGENSGGSCISCTRCFVSSAVEFGFKENLISNWNRRSAEARGAAEERAKSIGYLFDNPDTETEYLPYHPIESGECQDAENIREATSAELLSELQSAWTSWKEDRDEKEKVSASVAALEARVKELTEYYEAAEAISFNASSEQCDRLDRARAALTREGGV